MATKATMKNVQEMAQKYSCSFYKGPGYFYFSDTVGIGFYESGVYVKNLTSLSLEKWEQELQAKIQERDQ